MTPAYFDRGRSISTRPDGKYKAVRDGPGYRPEVGIFDTYEEAVTWIQL